MVRADTGFHTGFDPAGCVLLLLLLLQIIRDKKTKKSKGFGIVSLLDGGDFAKVGVQQCCRCLCLCLDLLGWGFSRAAAAWPQHAACPMRQAESFL